MTRTKKTYSVSDAATATGSHIQWLYRLCQCGAIGKLVPIGTTGRHYYELSEKDLTAIKARKRRASANKPKQA